MSIPLMNVPLSGERVHVTYRLAGDEKLAHEKAAALVLEQTVEFPAELVPAGDIREKIVGHIAAFERADENHFTAVIDYAAEITGGELAQFLNVLFGNSSLKPGIRVEKFELPPALLEKFRGPRFGRAGWRARLGLPKRPLLATALKPMGLAPHALAELAYQFALGGIDLIKDDHGLADQTFCPFRERVEQCAQAVARANRVTGMQCVYMPNLTAPADRVIANARFARAAGAGALMISPGITGLDTMRLLSDDDSIALPIMAHPALQGSFVTHPDNGISHYALFGQIARLAGADASIFPNVGGRFSFSRAECASIVKGAQVKMGHVKPIFPTPGGGMSLERVQDMLELYGREVIFLVGGGLHTHSPNLVANCRAFRKMVEEF